MYVCMCVCSLYLFVTFRMVLNVILYFNFLLIFTFHWIILYPASSELFTKFLTFNFKFQICRFLKHSYIRLRMDTTVCTV